MKKTLYFIVSLSFCMMACNKFDAEVPETKAHINPETHEVTLDASIKSDPDTRVSYAAKNSGLKCTWDAGDQMTLVTYNADDRSSTLATIDNLTLDSGAGKASATFKGTITGTPGAYYLLVYPAVTQTQVPPYESVQVPNDVPRSQSLGHVIAIEQAGDDLVLILNVGVLKAQGSKTNVKHLNNCPMIGRGSIHDGVVLSSTVLEQECSVIKLKYTLPSTWNDKTLYAVYLNWTTSATDQAPFADRLFWKLGKDGQYAGLYATSPGFKDQGPFLYIGGHWIADYTPVAPAGYNVSDFGNDLILFYPYLAPQDKVPFPQSSVSLYGRPDEENGLGYLKIAEKGISSGLMNERGKLYSLTF